MPLRVAQMKLLPLVMRHTPEYGARAVWRGVFEALVRAFKPVKACERFHRLDAISAIARPGQADAHRRRSAKDA